MRIQFIKGKNLKVYTVLVIMFAVLSSFPFYFSPIQCSLDPSWCYAVNKFSNFSYVFGKDVVFTYGPLGFLLKVNNINYNLCIGTFFWLLIALLHIVLLWQYIWNVNKWKSPIALLLGITLYIQSQVDLVSNDYYLGYIAAFSLFLFFCKLKKYICVFSLFLVFSFFLKFTLFATLFLCAFIVVILESRKTESKDNSIILLGSMLLIPIIYFFMYGLRLESFIDLIKGYIEFSSGYSIAMSADNYNNLAIIVLFVVLLWGTCVVISYRSGSRNFIIMIISSVFLCCLLKHGSVRADSGHTVFAMNAILMHLSLVVFFVEWKQFKKPLERKLYIVLLSILGCICIFVRATDYNANSFTNLKHRIFDLPSRYENVYYHKNDNPAKLPKVFIQQIDNHSVSIYPWEISYWASHDLRFVPLGGLQAYSLYTPYLDKISSEKFIGADKPEYIVFSLDAIDNRWPLIEAPKTWDAIHNNYFITTVDKDLYLLKAKENPNVANLKLLKKSICKLNEPLYLRKFNYLKVYPKLNLKGHIYKLFWKIPEVQMEAKYEDGTVIKKRVLLNMLENGVEIGSLPYDRITFINLLNDSGILSEIRSIQFVGEGLSCYNEKAIIELYDKTINTANKEYTIKTPCTVPLPKTMFQNYAINYVPMKFNTEFSAKYKGFYRLRGWAFIEGVNLLEGDYYVGIENKSSYYLSDKILRSDVKKAFNLPVDNVGFEILAKGESFLNNLIIMDKKKKVIYRMAE